MSETIYIRETHEFLTENGCILKESDLTPAERAELMEDCSKVNRLFGSEESSATVLKG